MKPSASYITYVTSSHEQNGDNITFTLSVEGGLVENKHNAE